MNKKQQFVTRPTELNSRFKETGFAAQVNRESKWSKCVHHLQTCDGPRKGPTEKPGDPGKEGK